MGYKFKLSDIIRYITVGIIVFSFILFAEKKKYFYEGTIFTDYLNKFLSIDWLGPILILFLSYFGGVFTFAIIRILFGKEHFGMSITDVCYYIKKTSFFSDYDDIPNWIYWTSHPGVIARELREYSELQHQSEKRSEFFLFNEFFRVLFVLSYIALVLVILSSSKFIIAIIVLIFLLIQILFSRRKAFLRLFLLKESKLKRILEYPFIPIILSLGNLILLVVIGTLGTDVSISTILLVGLTSCCFLCFIVSLFFAIEHIKQLNSICISNNDTFRNLLKNDDIPTAYILIRTNSDEYLEETLDSINIQTYPSIKTIILEDNSTRQGDSDNNVSQKIEETICTFQKNNNCKFDIQRFYSNKSGPYQLALEIKNIFLINAEDKDIAIILDSDDKLHNKDIVTNIVTKMYRTKSNICLMGFTVFGHLYLNNSKNYHNRFLKLIAKHLKSISLNPYSDSEINKNIYHIETLGWTKCYKKSILQNHQNCWNDLNLSEYTHLTKFEDFPDIVSLLQKDARITAISQPCYYHRKHKISVTNSATVDIYKNEVIPFLFLSHKLLNTKKELYKDGTENIIKKFIIFKFIQYLDTTLRRFEGNKPYSGMSFWTCFKKKYLEEFCEDCTDAVKAEIESIKQNNIFNLNDTESQIIKIINNLYHMETLKTMQEILIAESNAIQNIPITEDYEKAVNSIVEHIHEKGGKLVASGMGKAGHIAVNIAATLSSTGTPSIYIHPSEAQHGDLGMIQPNDILLLISNSGKTREILDFITLAHNLYPQLPIIAITGNAESELAKKSDFLLATGGAPEVCPLGFAPTTSITVMSVIGDVLVVNVMKKINFPKEEYAKRHNGGSLGEKSKK